MFQHSAQVLSQLISADLERGGTLQQLATEVGYKKIDMITRIESREARLPLDKVLPFARAQRASSNSLSACAYTVLGYRSSKSR